MSRPPSISLPGSLVAVAVAGALIFVAAGCASDSDRLPSLVHRLTAPAGITLTDLAWSPDGQRIAAVSEEVPGQAFGRIHLFSIDPATDKVLTGMGTHLAPMWSADGLRLLAGWSCSEIRVYTEDGVQTGGTNGCVAVWAEADTEWLIFDAEAQRVRRVDAVTQETLEDWSLAGVKSAPMAGTSGISLAPDGRYLVLALNVGVQAPNKLSDRDLFELDLRTGGTIALVPGLADDYSPSFSSDGSRLAFVSWDGAVWRIGLYDLASGCVRYPLSSQRRLNGLDWSPIEAQTLAVTVGNEIWIIDTAVALADDGEPAPCGP